MPPERDDAVLRRQFRDMGIEVDQALPAWSGVKPFFDGYGNLNLLFTRWRVLVWRDGTVELWSRWSGLPSKRLGVVPATELSIEHESGTYDKVAFGRKAVWVPAECRDRLKRQAP